MSEHKFHKIIGEKIKSSFEGVLLDSACGGAHTLPLFFSSIISRDAEFCDVDILIIKNNKVKVIIEIEESDIKPNQICGKFLTSAISPYYAYKKDLHEMDDNTLFIQILDDSKLKDKTAKKEQGKNLSKAISNILPIKGSKITRYELLFGNTSNFDFSKLIQSITQILST